MEGRKKEGERWKEGGREGRRFSVKTKQNITEIQGTSDKTWDVGAGGWMVTAGTIGNRGKKG